VEDSLVALGIREEKTGAAVTFDEAVEMAGKEWEIASERTGKFITVPVKALQLAGYVAPELADVDMDKLTETLRQRLPAGAAAPVPARAQPAAAVAPARRPAAGTPGPERAPAAPGGLTTWQHPQGLMSLSFPSDFVSQLQPGASPGFMLLAVGNPVTTVSAEVMQIMGTQDPGQAVNYVSGVFAQMGGRLQVTGSTPMANGTMLINGMTYAAAGTARWTCLAKPVPGGVLLVSAGANAAAWAAQNAAIQSILSSVRFQ
jgi:hypothetical protein